jgi:hypothetical protein
MASRPQNLVILALALALIAAIALPMFRPNALPHLSLSRDDQLVVDCATKLSVSVQGDQATLRCAAPGTLQVGTPQAAALQPTSAALQPTSASAPTAAASGAELPAATSSSPPIFSDQLADGWQNWSWGSTIDLAAKSAHDGAGAIAVTYTAGWAGLYLHASQPLPTAGFDRLRFWASGGSAGGQQIRVCATNNCARPSSTFTLAANTWQAYDVPLRDIGVSGTLADLIWQDTTGGPQAQFLLDDVALVATAGAGASAAPATSSAGPALAVDAGADRHPISPLIYGMNFPDAKLAKELGLTIQRWGGNATTRYNWQLDVSNRASDWYFENIPNDDVDAAALPKGSSSDQFVEQGRQAGIQSILTIPLIGWTPKSREVSCGFAISKYGPQQQADDQRGCGNGRGSDEKPLTGNDPADTSKAIDPQFVADWIKHLTTQYGAGDKGGVSFYNLDNEPFLWHITHRDVHPEPVSYDELRDRTYQYAAALKQADPSAKTLGPSEWGWTGYFFSAKDSAPGGSWYNDPLDRKAHGDTPFVEWYLDQMKAYEQQHGVRLLDYLDLHYYPQSQGVALQGAGDASTQELRLRSTRSLWDTSYTDESWINEPIRLIPRMKEWAQRYPGTKISLSEYNWGALDTINGALAQADVLGIFGREGLDLATLWAPPSADQPGAYAFRMFRNYDGQGAAFGDTSLRATTADPDRLAIYAAARGEKTITMVVVNKSADDLTSPIALQGVSPSGPAHVYRYSAANLGAIERGDDLAVKDGALSASFPASSITLIEVPLS